MRFAALHMPCFANSKPAALPWRGAILLQGSKVFYNPLGYMAKYVVFDLSDCLLPEGHLVQVKELELEGDDERWMNLHVEIE